MAVNDHRKRAMGLKVVTAADVDLHGKRVAVFGLTFKPKTDDMRDSPAIAVVQTLEDADAMVTCPDPEGMDNVRQMLAIEFAAGAVPVDLRNVYHRPEVETNLFGR